MSFFSLIIEACNEDSRKESDPECSSKAEIDEWMQNKAITIKVID